MTMNGDSSKQQTNANKSNGDSRDRQTDGQTRERERVRRMTDRDDEMDKTR